MLVAKWLSNHVESFTVATMTPLRDICVTNDHNPVLSSCLTYHQLCNKSYTMGVTHGEGTAYPSGVHEFTLDFSVVRFRSLVFCVMFYRLLFVLLLFFFWPLCCISFFNGFSITRLVSLNLSLNILILLTYSIYFSYAIFSTDYKKILKIASGVKQLTAPLLPYPNCSMPENYAQCVIPVKRTSDHSVHWADQMADRFEDVSDEDIELLLKKRDSNITKHVIKGAVRILQTYCLEKNFDFLVIFLEFNSTCCVHCSAE